MIGESYLFVISNSLCCHWWLSPAYVIFWIDLHRHTCKGKRQHKAYSLSAWSVSGRNVVYVYVCILDWRVPEFWILCSYPAHSYVNVFFLAVLFSQIDEGIKSNSFVYSNLNQQSFGSYTTALLKLQLGWLWLFTDRKIIIIIVSTAYLFPEFFSLPTTANILWMRDGIYVRVKPWGSVIQAGFNISNKQKKNKKKKKILLVTSKQNLFL